MERLEEVKFSEVRVRKSVTEKSHPALSSRILSVGSAPWAHYE